MIVSAANTTYVMRQQTIKLLDGQEFTVTWSEWSYVARSARRLGGHDYVAREDPFYRRCDFADLEIYERAGGDLLVIAEITAAPAECGAPAGGVDHSAAAIIPAGADVGAEVRSVAAAAHLPAEMADEALAELSPDVEL